jgi:hypothetical protein
MRLKMRRLAFAVLLQLWLFPLAHAQDCAAVAAEMELPQKVKTRGKPKFIQWERVDKTLNGLQENLGNLECQFTFAEVFRTENEDIFFPLTNSLIRIAPESALQGLEVFNKDGELLGTFEGRVLYERSGGLEAMKSYSLYYFQFRDRNGKLQSTGHQLLYDRFGVKWMGVKDRAAISTD